MKKNTFKAQALAIVMVVLVVASIIGISLFSRMSKDKDSAVNQQDSSISSSQVDSILDLFIGADISNIETVLGEDIYDGPYDSLSAFANFLEAPGGDTDLAIVQNATDLINPNWCPGQNSINVALEYADENDLVEIQPGGVMAYNLDGASISSSPDGCTLQTKIGGVDDKSVFIIKKVMRDEATGEVTESVSNYCIQRGVANGNCENIDNVEYEEDSITYLTSAANTGFDDVSQLHYININLENEIGNDVVEIRVLPIKGVLAISNSLTESCVINKQFLPIKISASANCNDTYRGEEMFLPGSGLLGYSTLFDYGIYDVGLFQP